MIKRPSPAAEKVLERLRGLEFEVHPGAFAPFDDVLPLVVGVAWDARAAQLAIVAEQRKQPFDREAWEQLLFACSGLRSHLTANGGSDGRPALATPVLLALAGADHERELHELAETIDRHYLLFDRVDINIVSLADGEPKLLDLDLAPLLPNCRAAIDAGMAVSRKELDDFWAELDAEIMQAGTDLDERYGSARQEATARHVSKVLLGHRRSAGPDLPKPQPIGEVELADFRSFRSGTARLGGVTIVSGANGSGKSSLVEALELLWSGDTGRRLGARIADYARHLKRDGEMPWSVTATFADGGNHPVSDIAEQRRCDLSRAVLTQDSVRRLVELLPQDRMSEMLRVAGLDVPQLTPVTSKLQQEGKDRFNRLLASLGLPPLPSASVLPLVHLDRCLRTEPFESRLPDLASLHPAERLVADAAAGSYAPRYADLSIGALGEALRAADGAVRAAAALSETPARDPSTALGAAARHSRDLAISLQSHAASIRKLLAALDRAKPADQPPVPPKAGVISQAFAARWKAHVSGLTATAGDFAAEARRLEPGKWRERLERYEQALRVAIDSAPTAELDRELEAAAQSDAPVAGPTVPEEAFREAGFAGAPSALAESALDPLAELETLLERHGTALNQLADDLARHPARRLAEQRDALLDAACVLDLARRLRRPGSPIENANETLMRRMLDERLVPVFRELIAAMVRFEWYFKPLKVEIDGREARLAGLATDRSDLDARYLLNAAERCVVGVAWFLALHLLQPQEDRRVLILDDPTSDFDEVNRAAFISTFRAFARLARPEQVVLSTHDQALAALLEVEFAPVSGWPSRLHVVTCARDAEGLSTVETDEAEAVRPTSSASSITWASAECRPSPSGTESTRAAPRTGGEIDALLEWMLGRRGAFLDAVRRRAQPSAPAAYRVSEGSGSFSMPRAVIATA